MTPDLSAAQLSTLAATIRAEPNVAAFVAAGDDGSVAAYYNGGAAGPVKAWTVAQRADMYDAMTISLYDNLTAGKRDSWRMMMDYAPTDFRGAKKRKAVTDIWGASEAANVLAGCATRNATRAETLFGGNSKTESTVTALVLNNEGDLTIAEVAKALRP